MSKPDYEILVFDIDDTLIVEKHSVENGLKAVLAPQGETYQNSDFDRWAEIEANFWHDYRKDQIRVPEKYLNEAKDEHGRGRREWVRAQRIAAFLSLSETDLGRAYQLLDVFEKAMQELVVPVVGVCELLSDLTQSYVLVAATDGVHEIAEHKLRSIGAIDYFSEVISPLTTGAVKPKPAFFEPIFAKFGRELSRYLVVGNSLKADIKLANNLRIDSCLYNSWNAEITEEIQPTFTINEFSELRQILL